VAVIIHDALAITRDGGKRWRTASLPHGTVPDSLDFVSATAGWLLASPDTSLTQPVIYHTVDGGARWIRQFSGRSSDSGGVLDMTSAQDGWAIVSGTLHRTMDGGAQWTPIRLPSGNVPTGLSFAGTSQGWVATMGTSRHPEQAVWATVDGHHFQRILKTANTVAAMTLHPDGAGAVLEASAERGPAVWTDAGHHR
jgi:hypothetical protein